MQIHISPPSNMQASSSEALAVSSSQPGAEDGEEGGKGQDEPPPWADEVSTLLLGLVGISHQCYLDKPVADK